MEPNPNLLFGKMAVKNGLLSEEQVESLVRQQAQAAEAGVPTTLGELCQMKRLLTSEQVQALLLGQEFALQRQEDRLLGALAVKNGFATEEEVGLALDEQKRRYQEDRKLPTRLGEVLVDMDVLSEQQLRALLSAQTRLKRSASPRDAAQAVAPPPSPVCAAVAAADSASGGADGNTGRLVQESGEGKGRTIRLGRKAVLGRQPENDVPLADGESSRQHARIEFIQLARQHVLTDLNSRNGTFVNGEQVEEPRALTPGDRIRIGETVFRYEAGPAVATGAVAPDETAVAPLAMPSQRRTNTVVAPRATGLSPTGQRAAATETGARPHPPAGNTARSAANPQVGREQERTILAPSSRKPAATRPCPECGYELSEKAKFCKGCGSPVALEIARRAGAPDVATESPRVVPATPLARLCPMCGVALATGMFFCPSCGADARPRTSPGAPPDSSPRPLLHAAQIPGPDLATRVTTAGSPIGPPANAVTAGGEALGTVMVLAPVFATILIWSWVGSMNLLQGPGSALAGIVCITIIGTALLAAVEAGQLGMGSPTDVTPKGKRRGKRSRLTS